MVPLILVVSLDTSDEQHEGGHGGQVVGGQEGGAQGQGCNTWPDDHEQFNGQY